jgi:hypothetical protein
MSDLVVRVAADLTKFRENFKNIDSQIDTTASALKTMSSAFDGSKTIANANAAVIAVDKIGGATKLTSAEQERLNRILDEAVQKYTLMGREAPAAMLALQEATKGAGASVSTMAVSTDAAWASMSKLAGAFGIGLGVSSLVQLGTSALESASRVGDLASKLGTSAEFVQRMSYVAGQSGTDIGVFQAAIAKMNATLGEGDASTRSALRDVGLSFDEIRAKSPEDAFTAITTAIEGMSDPMAQANAAVQLFGRSGQEMLPAIKEGMAAIAAEAPIMSDAVVGNLKRAGDQIEALKNQITVGAAPALGLFAAAFEGFANLSTAPLVLWSQDLGELSGRMREGVDGVTALVDGVRVKLPAGLQAAGPAISGVTEKIQEQLETSEQSVKASDRHAEALATLASYSTNYRDTLAGINAETVTEIQGYMAAGASLSVLQEAYTLTEAQIRAISMARQQDIALARDQWKAADDYVKAELQGLASSSKLWAEYNEMRVSLGATSTDQQIAQINRWATETAAAFEASKNRALMSAQTVADFYDALSAATSEKLGRIGVDIKALTDAATNDSQAGLQQIADAAKRTYDIALTHTGEWSDATIEKFRRTWEAAQNAANGWSASTITSLDQVGAKSEAVAAKISLSFNQAMELVRKGLGTMTGSVPANTDFSDAKRMEIQKAANEHRYYGPVDGFGQPDWAKLGFGQKVEARAEGGPVASHQPYMVGERGPELFVPSTSGAIVPNGGGGVTLHTTVNVGGSVIGVTDLGRAIDDAILSTLRNSGAVLPVRG